MKLYTKFDSKWYDWHKVFLWLPTMVYVGDIRVKNKVGTYSETKFRYTYVRMWLCFVERRYTPQSVNTNFCYFLKK